MSHSVLTATTDEHESLDMRDHTDIMRDITAAAHIDTKQLSTLTSTGTNLINQAVFLSGHKSTTDGDAAIVGGVLCAELKQFLSDLDETFAAIIINDYSLSDAIAARTIESAALNSDISRLRCEVAAVPVPPQPTERTDAIAIAELDLETTLTKELNEQIDALTTTGVSTRSAAEQAEQAIHEQVAQIKLLEVKFQSRLRTALLELKKAAAEETQRINLEHAAHQKRHSLATLELQQKLQQQARKNIEIGLLNMYRTFSNLLVQKLKDKIKQYDALYVDIGSNVIPSTNLGHEIVDFMGQSSLPGIFHALWQKYRKPTTAQFSHALVRLINYRSSGPDSKSNPMKAVNEIDALKLEWHRRDFNRLLTVDVLFSLVLANSYADNSRARAADNVAFCMRHAPLKGYVGGQIGSPL